jgi:FkbM family methyltransferase
MQKLKSILLKFYFLFKEIEKIFSINKNLSHQIDSCYKADNFYHIKLKNEKTFISYDAPKHLQRLHFLLKKKIRKVVPAEAMNVLVDINFRYLGQNNLKNNLKEGKYTDLKPGDIVFEIGAYIGLHAIKLSEIVGPSGKIIAVEAIPRNFALLKKNTEINGIKNITLVNLAVWKKKGAISFNLNENQKNSAVENVVKTKQKTDLPCDTIDNIFNEQACKTVDFVRIQTNGAELEAIEGMAKTLSLKPKLLVAVPYKNKDVIQQKLKNLGYQTTFTGHSILAV